MGEAAKLNVKSALILGLGRSGLSAARALLRRGTTVCFSDIKSEAELGDYVSQARDLGVEIALGSPANHLLQGRDLVLLSPGVPGSLDIVQAARQQGIRVMGEIELAFEMAPRKWAAVTGTNGKTTTTAWLAAMFEAAGADFLLGGNIGQGLADRIDDSTEAAWVVAELSSFQLEETIDFSPRVAVITNLTPDHLDRYSDMAAYAAAKARIFAQQSPTDDLILNGMDTATLALALPARSRKLLFHREAEVEQGAWVRSGRICYRLQPGPSTELLLVSELSLPGPHNLENAMAAALAALAAGLDPIAVAGALREFKGVEHRLEPCGEVSGVRFINDSKATNVDSVDKALKSFQAPLHMIMGGRDKAGDFGALAPLMKGVKRLILIGEAADKIESQLASHVRCQRAASMQEAVRMGLDGAEAGDIVLLSPACASFDMFKNYEHRGQVFKEAVQSLEPKEQLR